MATRSSPADGEGESETVWIVSDPDTKYNARCYHTNPGCLHVDLDRFRELSRERAEKRFGARECSECAGTAAPPPGVGDGHYEALLAAAESDDGPLEGGE